MTAPHLADHADLERENLVEVHEPVWENVEDRATRIRDDVERKLAPFERSARSSTTFTATPVPANVAAEPIIGVGADRRERRTTLFCRTGVAVAIAVDRRRKRRQQRRCRDQKRRRDVLRCRRRFAAKRRRTSGYGNALRSVSIARLSIVGFGGNDRDVGIVRRRRVEGARRVDDVQADASE